MLYTAKCFWPGVTEGDLRLAAERAGSNAGAHQRPSFVGLLHLPGDELALALFEADSPLEVKRASEAAGMPCERVIATVWVAPHTRGGLLA
jgi:hypothetical protein